MSSPPRYRYGVERVTGGTEPAQVALVRRSGHARRLGGLGGRGSEPKTVLFSRMFKPLVELHELERYAGELQRVADHCNAGTFGCFVDARSRQGLVEISLYERWFDGHRLCCDELAHREFDADAPEALVASAEFVAELADWAQRRNEQRERSYLETSVEDAERQQRSLEHESAARDLARIIESLDSDPRLI